MQNSEDIIVYHATGIQWICVFYCFYMGRNAKNVALYYTADHLDPRMNGLQSAFSQLNPLHEGLPLVKILKDVYIRNFHCQNSSETSGNSTISLAHRQS